MQSTSHSTDCCGTPKSVKTVSDRLGDRLCPDETLRFAPSRCVPRGLNRVAAMFSSHAIWLARHPVPARQSTQNQPHHTESHAR